MAHKRRLSRRQALAIGAGAAALPLCHIRTAGAAGKLSMTLPSHFVPGVDEKMRTLVDQWGATTKTEVQIDFVSADSAILIRAAEAQARTGHDIAYLGTPWDVVTYGSKLEPMDDTVQRLSARYGPIMAPFDALAVVEGANRAVPVAWFSAAWPSETRIDLFRQHVGMDVQAVFPATPETGPGYDQWTWDAFLLAAEKCFTAGYPFGLPMGKTNDTMLWVGALFHSFGAELVDAGGNITAKSDKVRAVLDYAKHLMPFLPADVYSWDDTSNNRALISGKSALIFNPPSAWAVGLRDNHPVGEQIWHHPLPSGPAGRFLPFKFAYLGVWNFSKNKSAANELIEFLSQREQVEKLCTASRGYEIPPFISMTDFAVWAAEGPPQGSLFNYPLKPSHHAELSVAGWPAPPAIAAQIVVQATMPKMIARVTQSGMSIEQSITLAEQELEGFMR